MAHQFKVSLHLRNASFLGPGWIVSLAFAKTVFEKMDIDLEVKSFQSNEFDQKDSVLLKELVVPKMVAPWDPPEIIKHFHDQVGSETGIHVLYTGGKIFIEDKQVNGYSTTYLMRPLILMSNNVSQMKWTLSHELGHILADVWQHDDDPKLIMSPTYKLGPNPDYSPEQKKAISGNYRYVERR